MDKTSALYRKSVSHTRDRTLNAKRKSVIDTTRLTITMWAAFMAVAMRN